MYNLGLIGNCQISALIDNYGTIQWMCFPRPDAPPVFGKLLDPYGGEFSIELMSSPLTGIRQYYLENTNILITEIKNDEGTIRITDFCPRFYQYERIFRPCYLIRIVEVIEGSPQIKVNCSPIDGWKKNPVIPHQGNAHLRFEYGAEALRLSTNMPLTYVLNKSSFRPKEKIYLALTWAATIEEDLPFVCEKFYFKTEDYWKVWVKHCSIPTIYQKETIRSALALKLHCYEDTGAILAATTTSLPEEIGGTRNWDYRFCWPRDTHFVLSALHSLGHFEEMEGYLKYLLNIAESGSRSSGELSPVYTVDQKTPLPEHIQYNWEGYKLSRPVRTNNQAAEHIQNDIYGEMILTLAPIYFDERFVHLRTKEHEALLFKLADLAKKSINVPDAGLWEIRDHNQIHTFTHLMTWAGLDRINKIAKKGLFKENNFEIENELIKVVETIMSAVQNGVVTNGPSDKALDASMLLLPILRFPDKIISKKTILEIYKQLKSDGNIKDTFFFRYLRDDGFGRPKSSFVICSFWMAQSFALIGETHKAKEIFENVTKYASNHLGLLSEHFDNNNLIQLGNFPQAYSHVGLINAAFAIAPSWSEIL